MSHDGEGTPSESSVQVRALKFKHLQYNGSFSQLQDFFEYKASLKLERIGADHGSLSCDQLLIYCSCHGNILDNSNGIISAHF